MSGIKLRMTTELTFGGNSVFGQSGDSVRVELEGEGDSHYSGRAALTVTHVEKAMAEQRKMATAIIEQTNKARGSK